MCGRTRGVKTLNSPKSDFGQIGQPASAEGFGEAKENKDEESRSQAAGASGGAREAAQGPRGNALRVPVPEWETVRFPRERAGVKALPPIGGRGWPHRSHEARARGVGRVFPPALQGGGEGPDSHQSRRDSGVAPSACHLKSEEVDRQAGI